MPTARRVGFDAVGSDIHVGLMPDLEKRVRYQAIVVAAPTSSVPPRVAEILDGAPEGIIQFHELPGVGSNGDEKRGDLAVVAKRQTSWKGTPMPSLVNN